MSIGIMGSAFNLIEGKLQLNWRVEVGHEAIVAADKFTVAVNLRDGLMPVSDKLSLDGGVTDVQKVRGDPMLC
jgi:hypothetical protein